MWVSEWLKICENEYDLTIENTFIFGQTKGPKSVSIDPDISLSRAWLTNVKQCMYYRKLFPSLFGNIYIYIYIICINNYYTYGWKTIFLQIFAIDRKIYLMIKIAQVRGRLIL